VLLKPAFSPGNAALWLAPFAIAGCGLLLLWARLRNRKPESELTEGEAQRLRDITQDETP
jgi:cytochrome c-type biogenesis protein CcmH